MATTTATELLISPERARLWEVVERPSEDRRLETSEIKTLYSCPRKDLALASAEGRQSITGQPIRMPEGY